jgi:hypothetical protein
MKERIPRILTAAEKEALATELRNFFIKSWCWSDTAIYFNDKIFCSNDWEKDPKNLITLERGDENWRDWRTHPHFLERVESFKRFCESEGEAPPEEYQVEDIILIISDHPFVAGGYYEDYYHLGEDAFCRFKHKFEEICEQYGVRPIYYAPFMQFIYLPYEKIFDEDDVHAHSEYFFPENGSEGFRHTTVPTGFDAIGDRAFQYNERTRRITISEGVQTIGDEAFLHCDDLEEIELPDSLIEIGERAFFGCSELISITIPRNLKTLRDFLEGLFERCYSLQYIRVHPDNDVFYDVDGILYSKAHHALLRVPRGYRGNSYGRHSGNIVIPDSVKTIAENANLHDLPRCCFPTITIPRSAIVIFEEAFGIHDLDEDDKNCGYFIRCPDTDKELWLNEYEYRRKMLPIIRCYEGSAAHEFAQKNNLEYEILPE